MAEYIPLKTAFAVFTAMIIIYIGIIYGGGSMNIVKGAKRRIPDMKKLWLEVFKNDSPAFVDTFFEKFYKNNNTLLCYDGKRLVSMLYWIDIKIKYNRRVYKGAYLYGVATLPTERGAGLFSRLHDVFVDTLLLRSYKFVIAIPETDSLFSMYKKLGYTAPFRTCEYSISSLDFDELTPEEAFERRSVFCKKKKKGFTILESRDMFLESADGHRFLGFDGGYFAFVKKDGRYVMYDVCDPDGNAPPHKLLHYERSGVLLDLAELFDEDFAEREKPILNFLLS